MTFPVVSLWIVLKPQVFFTCLFRGVDIIAAAFFGLIFLGETINYLHFIALFLSAVGALFISQPEFLFGSDGHENHLGSVLALLSGFFQAASFICARKSQHISVAVLTFFSLFLAVFMSLLPPLLPMVHTATGWQWMILEVFWNQPNAVNLDFLIHFGDGGTFFVPPISGFSLRMVYFWVKTTWLSDFPSNP
jgi:drug/metabolite transporter (DMT)-like permease